MASLMLAFPQVTHWELSNEYDLPGGNKKPEELCDWANYRAYHRQFADILSIIAVRARWRWRMAGRGFGPSGKETAWPVATLPKSALSIRTTIAGPMRRKRIRRTSTWVLMRPSNIWAVFTICCAQ